MDNFKIIATNFDGTLCIGDNYPEIGEPNWPVIRYLQWRQKNGAKIILWTCRTGEQLRDAIEWCFNHGLIFDAINDDLPETKAWMGTDNRKIFAHEYLDDRARNPKDMTVFYADGEPYMMLFNKAEISAIGDDWVIIDGKRYILDKE